MKVDCTLLAGAARLGPPDLKEVAARAQEAEEVGFDRALVAEGAHDPFLLVLRALEHTKHLQLATGIAVAFSRTPMHLALMAHDLHVISEGRFVMGLGSQVKAHVENRLGGAWGQPAARMRELILAVRAIWRCWNEGERLDFRGDFYRHTLMTPFFHPGKDPFGCPQIHLAGVGPRMTEVAGEVADGLFAHIFTTTRYLRETTLPAIQRGLDLSQRSREEFEVSVPVFLVTGTTEREFEAMDRAVRLQIGFYGSTPAYREVLETHGLGDLQPRLRALSLQGEWDQMGRLIDDEMLGIFAVRGELEEIPAKVLARFGELADRVVLSVPCDSNPTRWANVLSAMRMLE